MWQSVYNISIRLVAQLADTELEAGHHVAVWVAGSVPEGIYLMQMETTDFKVVRKVIHLR